MKMAAGSAKPAACLKKEGKIEELRYCATTVRDAGWKPELLAHPRM